MAADRTLTKVDAAQTAPKVRRSLHSNPKGLENLKHNLPLGEKESGNVSIDVQMLVRPPSYSLAETLRAGRCGYAERSPGCKRCWKTRRHARRLSRSSVPSLIGSKSLQAKGVVVARSLLSARRRKSLALSNKKTTAASSGDGGMFLMVAGRGYVQERTRWALKIRLRLVAGDPGPLIGAAYRPLLMLSFAVDLLLPPTSNPRLARSLTDLNRSGMDDRRDDGPEASGICALFLRLAGR
jgi:hypothetical protein